MTILTALLHGIAWPMLVLWLLGLLGLLRRPDPSLVLEAAGAEPDPPDAERVTVIVPARNEAAHIVDCVGAALAQDHPTVEVIVVDDRSSDGTGDLARALASPRLRVVAGEGPPPGWAGKPAACQLGAAAARPGWLLFVDADVRLAPWAVRRALAVARARQLDLLSLWGRWTLVGFWERLLLPAVGGLIRAAQSLEKINDSTKKEAFANGQFLLFAAAAYQRIDGHRRVQQEVLEDVALGRAVKQDGLRLGMLLAPGAFSVRLYRGLAEIWHGFSKNLYAGMAHRPLLALLAVGIIAWLHLGPLAVLLAGAASGSLPLVGAGGASLAAQLLVRAHEERSAGRHPGWAFGQPLAQVVLAGIICNSALRHHLGLSVSWKGRAVKP